MGPEPGTSWSTVQRFNHFTTKQVWLLFVTKCWSHLPETLPFQILLNRKSYNSKWSAFPQGKARSSVPPGTYCTRFIIIARVSNSLTTGCIIDILRITNILSGYFSYYSAFHASKVTHIHNPFFPQWPSVQATIIVYCLLSAVTSLIKIQYTNRVV